PRDSRDPGEDEEPAISQARGSGEHVDGDASAGNVASDEDEHRGRGVHATRDPARDLPDGWPPGSREADRADASPERIGDAVTGDRAESRGNRDRDDP